MSWEDVCAILWMGRTRQASLLVKIVNRVQTSALGFT